MKPLVYFFAFQVLAIVFSCSGTQNKVDNSTNDNEKPNLVIIFCDDLGYGDVGCFGATDISTPNIDQMATDGMKFTEFYSASPVCSPSRAALMTGRYPQRMGINSVFFPESLTGMAPEEVTIAEKLKEKGYATGIVGKWHLGHLHQFLPLQQGFDSYFGIPYSNDMESVVYMEGNEVVEFHVDQRYTTKTYTEKAVEFINDNAEEPFFLYLAHSMPHVPIYASEDFLGTSERGLYGDVVQEIDWSVGEVINSLKANNVLDNTLVVFSSDNGPWLVMEDHGGSAGGLREGKQYTFEGGQRVPTLAMWPEVIKPGSEYHNLATMMDWFPTAVEMTGGDLPADRPIDGVSLMPVLKGEGERLPQKFLYFDLDDLQCYREGDWKYKEAFQGFEGAIWKQAVEAHPPLLINLKEDPGEQNNLAEQYPEKVDEMIQKMNQEFQSMGELPPSLVIR
ncbi:MAG: sulfatase, partial [Bacteroidota bacterium]